MYQCTPVIDVTLYQVPINMVNQSTWCANGHTVQKFMSDPCEPFTN